MLALIVYIRCLLKAIIQLAETNIDESTNIKPSNQTAQPTTMTTIKNQNTKTHYNPITKVTIMASVK